MTLERPTVTMSYAALVATGPGPATVVLGREDPATTSTIRALHVADVG